MGYVMSGVAIERALPAAVLARARAAAARATTRARRHGASNNCTGAAVRNAKNGSRSAHRHGGRRALLVDGVGGRAIRDSEKPRDETSRNTPGNATKRPSDGKILENGEQNAGAWHGWAGSKASSI